ncbi:hypothetical protein LOTGIDRAFT_193764 [Lottia gigantea]|uniref:Alpha-methylacyl-CoA racemase n=1 Tax=Lottia gigantea TaxID=225164 RepID=V4A4I4_LOTGI|nr:hypothetical protein LOTGIDRAFT_193764 [Lottia gigantea]ESO88171.1 hypothetical protein LOTGIDRAFT_193764 [Lottia gigantea]
MALKGIKVIEMAGLAPAPFCGMILSDFGARVIRVDKVHSGGFGDYLSRGKESIAVDLKQPKGREIVHKLCLSADVVLEPFRAGVMEKLGLGPDKIMKENKRLIYARLTGYGQNGAMAQRAGHDINYLATSGILSCLGRKDESPQAPINLLADFAGGGMTCAMGIILALFERSKSGHGQIVDCSMTEGAAYLGKWLWASREMFIWGKERGDNVLDGGAAYYNTYKTKDNKYMAVGAIEPQFFHQLIQGLGLNTNEVNQFGDQVKLKEQFTSIFASKTQDEWTKIFENTDACCTPILTKDEAPLHPHNKENKTFLSNSDKKWEPGPAPKLSRTPGNNKLLPNVIGGFNTVEILKELGYTSPVIEGLIEKQTVEQCQESSKL